MDEMNIDIHREIYLVPWKKEWAHIFRMEKQNILAALAASEHTADIRHRCIRIATPRHNGKVE